MSREDVQKLLGGYATGTLTPEEQEALFAAALDDQELFDALAREQSLRDLLRDPAAKAEVLAALDTARVPWYRQSWWRPVAVAAAMAGIAVMAVVVTRKQAEKPAAVIVAELKPTAPPEQPAGPTEPAAPIERRAEPSTAPKRRQVAAAPMKDLPAPPAPAAAPPPPPAEQPAVLAELKKETATPPPAVAAPVPQFSADKSLQVQQTQAAPMMPQAPQAQQGLQGGQPVGQLGLRDAMSGGGGRLDSRLLAQDARLLFYGNPVAAEADLVKQKAAKKAPAANTVAASTGLAAVPAFHMGVRCSILRKQANGETAEVGIETVLDAGEQVKLKIVPNDRGYLKVWDGSASGTPRAVASGTATPLQPFEAALPAGARQLFVQFTRDSRPALQLNETRNGLIQTADDREKATYVVNRASDGANQQLVVPITLKYK